jgi:hypothetical protein
MNIIPLCGQILFQHNISKLTPTIYRNFRQHSTPDHMIKGFFILIAANISAATVFFITGTMANNGLLLLCGWIFVAASAMLLVFLVFMRRRLKPLAHVKSGQSAGAPDKANSASGRARRNQTR